jgi:hypothetical protein
MTKNGSPSLNLAIQSVVPPDLPAHDIERIRRNEILKAHLVRDKLRYDEHNRLQNTLLALRSCQIFNYRFVSNIPLLTLSNEIHVITALPFAADFMIPMQTELARYKSNSDHEFLFLVKLLKNGILGSNINLICLIYSLVHLKLPSSGTAERVFSLLAQCFSDKQANTLEDCKEASVMLRYNNNFRNKK